MWLYSQSSGKLWKTDGSKAGYGYSGNGAGKNNPELEEQKNVGPIPRGEWEMVDVYDSDKLGSFVIILEPVGHDAHGRTDFRVHGDSIKHPGEASEGCIVTAKSLRRAMYCEGQKLRVVE